MSYFRVQYTPTRIETVTNEDGSPVLLPDGAPQDGVRVPYTNPDGSALIRKAFVWGLHNVARLLAPAGGNIRVSVRQVLLKRDEPTEADIAAAAETHSRAQAQARIDRLRQEADAIAASLAPATGDMTQTPASPADAE